MKNRSQYHILLFAQSNLKVDFSVTSFNSPEIPASETYKKY
jgi:hypothetical protein